MIRVKQVLSKEEKSKICKEILTALSEWFGDQKAVENYQQSVQSMIFFTAFEGEQPIGFIALKSHNANTSEVIVMGVLPAYHHQGIGRQLIKSCESYCSNRKQSFLTVKTLAESAQSTVYAETRNFYYAMGFKSLEVFPLYWDEENPCLLMVKSI